ncbi:sugar phosphate isomerase/epimerase family protein [Catalinimonas niigatensis]|uniref:sugar phosphate isomerase/epimerase family protein n=1 Tax=Catalinimonas niigatensis TaxID=1397264 RepID=UPI0026669A51|nr:sugar phosphate isomerase/epimerase family protein [Catalinimonas niigatensis]WPP49433.1 sugar phosphate isomerase/epimerase family protein [Catalinimonas niigatensis]
MSVISRRQMLRNSAAVAGILSSAPLLSLFASEKRTYRIGACDWSIGHHSEVEAMATAHKIGLDGVQISLGKAENNMHLRQKEVRQAYKEAAKKYGVKVSSLAIGELNQVPYKSAPETVEWVSDSIDVAQAMDVSVILLAFFGNGDLKNDAQGTQEVIKRLKDVAPKAEKKGIILGIESWLSADEHLEIIEAVGSPNVRVYYDVANSHKMGYDIYEEMQRLGSEYICEVHAKENGYLLGKGAVDFERVKAILDDINYQGWVIIEGAIPEGMEMLEAYQANCQYVQSVFNPS